MTVILYQGGAPGVLYKLREDEPLQELEEILGGRLKHSILSRGARVDLVLFEREEATGLSTHYERRPCEWEITGIPLRGDVAVAVFFKRPTSFRDAQEVHRIAANKVIGPRGRGEYLED